MHSLNETETYFLHTMYALHEKGVTSVSVDISENSKRLFPNGYSVQKYNALVPNLVSEGFIKASYDAPRDGPALMLTNKALELFANG